MFFRRKDKQGESARGKKGASAGKGAKTRNGANTAASGTTRNAKRTKGSGQGKGTAGAPQSRAEAEAQVKRMLNDGSLDKLKTMMTARDPQEVVDKYPQETVNTIRNWLNQNRG